LWYASRDDQVCITPSFNSLIPTLPGSISEL
jgi:hypothetical protein